MKKSPSEIANANIAFGAHFAQTLSYLGLSKIFFSPGSRSTPLIVGIERFSEIELIPVLDERTAGFIALGQSMRENRPVGLICTSGSALTHWFPAITEASHSGVPLLLFSADRPPELQDCGAGQTIDQKHLFGNFVREFHQLEVPQLNEHYKNQLLSSLKSAYQTSIGINPGPVHLNFPFREPFLPTSTVEITYEEADFTFLSDNPVTYPDSPNLISREISHFKHPLIVAGQHIEKRYLNDLLGVAEIPIICDSLSSIRQSGASNLILRYENLLRDPKFAKEANPDLILSLGPLPTSKTLRKWIENTCSKRVVIEPRGIKVDPLSGESIAYQMPYEKLCEIDMPTSAKGWLDLWQKAEEKVNAKISKALAEKHSVFEGKLAYLLSLHMPDRSNLLVANSMPIRDLEWFGQKNTSNRKLFGNRGVNGIDGTLGTAMGIAHCSDQPSFLLTGDLAFLHDSNALLFSKQLKGSLTIFVINNNGGGIFEHLPISNEPEFEKYFVTPQNFDLSKLCASFGIKYSVETSWDLITEKIGHPITSGIEVIEIPTDRKKDYLVRQELLSISPNSNA